MSSFENKSMTVSSERDYNEVTSECPSRHKFTPATAEYLRAYFYEYSRPRVGVTDVARAAFSKAFSIVTAIHRNVAGESVTVGTGALRRVEANTSDVHAEAARLLDQYLYWTNTPQGHYFWSTIYRRIREYAENPGALGGASGTTKLEGGTPVSKTNTEKWQALTAALKEVEAIGHQDFTSLEAGERRAMLDAVRGIGQFFTYNFHWATWNRLLDRKPANTKPQNIHDSVISLYNYMREVKIVDPNTFNAGKRSDGYNFVVTRNNRYKNNYKIEAGCREFNSLKAAYAHWAMTRGGTPLGNESFELLGKIKDWLDENGFNSNT